MKKVLFIIAILLISGGTTLFAQDAGNTAGNNDSTDTTVFDEFNLDNDFLFDFCIPGWPKPKSEAKYLDHHSPTMEFLYGKTQTTLNNAFPTFADNYNLEARLGMTTTKVISNSNYVVKYKFNYASLNHTNETFGPLDTDLGDMGTKIWRLTLSGNEGYGWKIGPQSAVILYSGSGIAWNWVDFTDTLQTFAPDANTFSEGTRFGQQYEGGIKIKVFKYLTIGAGYETNQIYPRWLCWKWVGSGLIEGAGHGMAGWFVDKIKKSTPAIVPIVDFILHNAINYGMYELRKTDMNWPFETADPFVQNNFKVSMGFTF
jgi:opacity protein-like surface antigen